MNMITTTLHATEQITLPPITISYTCSCDAPNKKGICRMFEKGGSKKSSSTKLSKPLKLKGGWIVQPINCMNHVKYHLTQGSILFSGKVLIASYVPNLLEPITGYVYHASPNLPYTEKSYSVIIVKNPAIRGIDFTSKNSGWECGSGNAQVACTPQTDNARCVAGSKCNFIYKSNKED
jgi:hypothetical protein